MSFSLYGYAGNPRTKACQVVAKLNNIELKLVDTQPQKGVSQDYLKINRLGKIPTLVSEDGSFVLPEVLAVCVYCTFCFLLTASNASQMMTSPSGDQYHPCPRFGLTTRTNYAESITLLILAILTLQPYARRV
jgi:hypothetical protein